MAPGSKILVDEKIQLLIELHTKIQHFMDLYQWGKDHELSTETMESLQSFVSELNNILPVLESEIRNNDSLPREPDKDATDIEQLVILFQKEVQEDAGKLHSEHLLTARNEIDDLARQCNDQKYSAEASKVISQLCD